MKKYISIYFFFFILFSCHAFAGSSSLSLTTYYPAPTAAYNTLKLATNQATSPSTYCTGESDGTLFEDSTGTLYVCTGGHATGYPQESYNTFCSFDPTNPAEPNASCASYINGSICPTAAGFSQIWLNQSGGLSYDTFNISPHASVLSTVCSNSNSSCTAVNGTCTAWGPAMNTDGSNNCSEVAVQTCIASNAQCGGTSAVGTTRTSANNIDCCYGPTAPGCNCPTAANPCYNSSTLTCGPVPAGTCDCAGETGTC